MKMNGAHGAGAGIGAVASIILIALGKRAGLTLTNEEAVSLFGTLTTIGIGIGHGFHKLFQAGIVPTWKHFLYGKSKGA
jgi:hypothetical protein